MRSEQEVNAAIDRYADTVRRLCMLHLKNYADTEDIFQTVFLKYALHTAPFADGEHEKAWLIRVTLNACKDLLKSVFRSRTVALEAAANLPAPVPQENQEVLEAVLALPKKYKDVVYLHYYEGYSAPEIAGLLHRNVNTIYTWLGRAKALLRTALEEGVRGWMTGSAQPLTPSTQRKRSRNTPRPRWPPGSARRSAGGVWPPCWPAWPWWWSCWAAEGGFGSPPPPR